MAKKIFYKALLAGNLLIIPAAGCLSAGTPDASVLPVLNSPLAGGCLQRALEFKAQANWEGVTDQTRLALDSPEALTGGEIETLRYLSILASYHSGLPTTRNEIESFLADYPESFNLPEVKFLQANLWFYSGDYAAAYRAYDKIDPEALPAALRSDFTYKKAVSMLKTGYHTEARPLFAALSGEREYADAVTFYDAYIDYVNRDYDSAYRKFSKVPRSGEKGLEAEYYMTQIDFRNGDFKKVAREGAALLEKDVDAVLLPETMRVTGISEFKLGRREKALSLLERYLELTGDAAENTARYTLGTLYYDMGELDKAKEQFSRLTDDRNDVTQSSWLYLGQISLAQGNEREAAIAFDNASRMAFDADVAETALYNQAVIGATGGGVPFGRSSEALETFVATYPDSSYAPAVSSYLAASYYNDRNFEKALRSINMIKNPSPDVLKARQNILYRLGMQQLGAGETDRAIRSLSEAAQANIDPAIAAQANIWLGDAYYRKGNYKEAAAAYSDAIYSKKAGANTALAQYNLGYALMKLKDYKAALGHFKAAVAGSGLTSNQLTDAKLRIADCRYYTGNHKEALSAYQSLKSGSGQNAVYASLREAELIGRGGDIQRQISILKNLEESGDGGIWTQEILTSLAGAYSEAGDDANAARINAKILDTNPSEGTALQTLFALAENAEKLYNREDYDAALAAYRKLENSGNADFYPLAVAGIMRSSSSPETVIAYADKVLATPGLSAELGEEALFSKAVASIDLDSKGSREKGLAELKKLAGNPSREWGAMAALNLGQYYLDARDYKQAEEVLLKLVDSDSGDQYMLAKGYILLSDVYAAKGDNYLAGLYLTTLRDNYPGNEPEIFEMIQTRLKTLKQ